MFDMGKTFKQRDEVVHLAVELLDRYFFGDGGQTFEYTESKIALYTLTLFLIASKFDELDENIPLIKDITRY